MNIKLLRKVQKEILKEPRRFDMQSWFERNSISPCGTTACIGGFAVALSNRWTRLKRGERLMNVEGRATIYLDIEGFMGPRLFFISNWPERLKYAYLTAGSPLKRAKVAVKRIDLFIKSGGKE